MKKYFSNPRFTAGFVLFSIIFSLMLAGLFYLPYDPLTTDIEIKLQGISKAHLLGTDHLGRDVLSRIMYGSRITIFIGLAVTLAGLITGVLLGSLAGFFGNFTDTVIMKIIDVKMSFPGILLALMLISIFGPSIQNTILALSIMAVPRYTRITRSGFIKLRNSTFVTASRARGAGSLRIIFLHILPNIYSDLIVTGTLSFALAILSESGLSYLGLGVQPPEPSFGRMLSDAQRYIMQNPLGAVIPTLCITFLVLGLNLMGEGISKINRAS